MRLLYLEKGKSLYAKGDTCSFYDHGDVKLPATNKTTVSQLKKKTYETAQAPACSF